MTRLILPHILIALSLLLTSCVEHESTLFERRAREPQDMSGGQDACVPQTCGEGECGAGDDGCGAPLDCGPCTTARCPGAFEALLPRVLNPSNLQYDAGTDRLVYTSENGSLRLNELRLDGSADTSQLRNIQTLKHYALTTSAVYAGNHTEFFRIGRPGQDVRFERLLFGAESAASHGEDVWYTTPEPGTLWRLRAPETMAERVLDLTAAPAKNLLVVDDDTIWWVEGTGDLMALERANPTSATLTFQSQDPITRMVSWNQGVCLSTEADTGPALWCSASPTEPLEQVGTWGPSIVFDLDTLDGDRVILARTLTDRFNRGWQISTYAPRTGTEDVQFSVPTGGGIAPAFAPVTTDGTCLFLGYQETYVVQRSRAGPIGWLRLDAVP